jgi:hypothetical protein
MKLVSILSAGLLTGATQLVVGQGTFVFDQQSSDESRILEGGFGVGTGVQSFTPSLDSIGFVRLVVANDSTAIYSVNVRSNSPSGPILGTTDRLTVPGRSSSPITLYFSTPVGLSPGTTYYLEPIAPLYNVGLINASHYQYPGGTLFFDGVPNQQTYDMWFREGIVVPEPGTATLTLVGASLLLWRWRGLVFHAEQLHCLFQRREHGGERNHELRGKQHAELLLHEADAGH